MRATYIKKSPLWDKWDQGVMKGGDEDGEIGDIGFPTYVSINQVRWLQSRIGDIGFPTYVSINQVR